jgi:hypothetical protein
MGQASKLASLSRSTIDKSFAKAGESLSRTMEQRNVTGGAKAASLMGLQAAHASAVADNALLAEQKNKERRLGLAQFGAQMSPQATTAVPYHQKTS